MQVVHCRNKREHKELVTTRLQDMLSLNPGGASDLNLRQLAAEIEKNGIPPSNEVPLVCSAQAVALPEMSQWWIRTEPYIERFLDRAMCGAYGQAPHFVVADAVFGDASISAALTMLNQEELDPHPLRVRIEQMVMAHKTPEEHDPSDSVLGPILEIRGARGGSGILSSIVGFLEHASAHVDTSLNDELFSEHTINPLVYTWKNMTGTSAQRFEHEAFIGDYTGVNSLWMKEPAASTKLAKAIMSFFTDAEACYSRALSDVQFELVSFHTKGKTQFTVLPRLELIDSVRQKLLEAGMVVYKGDIVGCPAHAALLKGKNVNGSDSNVFNESVRAFLYIYNRLRKG